MRPRALHSAPHCRHMGGIIVGGVAFGLAHQTPFGEYAHPTAFLIQSVICRRGASPNAVDTPHWLGLPLANTGMRAFGSASGGRADDEGIAALPVNDTRSLDIDELRRVPISARSNRTG